MCYSVRMPISAAKAIEASVTTRTALWRQYPLDREDRLVAALATLDEAAAILRRRRTSRPWDIPARKDARTITQERTRVKSMLYGPSGRKTRRRRDHNRHLRKAEAARASRDGTAHQAYGVARGVARDIGGTIEALRRATPWKAIEIRAELVAERERLGVAQARLRYVHGEPATKARRELDCVDRVIHRALNPVKRAARRPPAKRATKRPPVEPKRATVYPKRPSRRGIPQPSRRWTPESARAALDGFAAANGRYPVARELTDPNLPSKGTVYRLLGSLPGVVR